MQNMHNPMPISPDARPATRGVPRRIWLALLAGSFVLPQARASAAPLRVAAASDLKFVLGHLLQAFEQQTGQRVQASYGSSGNFARQIRQGLPVHLFMSADEAWVLQLAEAGLTRMLPDGSADRGRNYAQGHLALYVPRGSSLVLDAELRGLRAGWAGVDKFAIANPELAPYGRAAREALEALGLWTLVQPRLVLGENIAQATQFVATGAAQAGITSLSLALAPELAALGRHIALPTTLHAPIRQRMVLLRNAPAAAARLYDYLLSPEAAVVFRRFGFET